MLDVTVLVANPINAFGGGIGRRLTGLVAGAIDFVKVALLLFLGVARQGGRPAGLGIIFSLVMGRRGACPAWLLFLDRFFEPGPAHFPGDEPFAVGMVLVLVEQLHVFVGARVALAQEFLVIKLVPLFVLGRLVPGGFESLA